MEENEVMAIDEEYVGNEIEETESGSGLGTGLAMLIGSGLTVAAIAAGKKLRKVWKNHKAKKENDKEGDEIIIEPDEVREVDTDDCDD